MEALITKYWALFLWIIGSIVWGSKQHGKILRNEEEIAELKKKVSNRDARFFKEMGEIKICLKKIETILEEREKNGKD